MSAPGTPRGDPGPVRCDNKKGTASAVPFFLGGAPVAARRRVLASPPMLGSDLALAVSPRESAVAPGILLLLVVFVLFGRFSHWR